MKALLPAVIAAVGVLCNALGVYAADNKAAMIETPDICHEVSRVEGNKVYLHKAQEKCLADMKGQITVMVPKEATNVEVFVDGALQGERQIQEAGSGGIGAAASLAGEGGVSIAQDAGIKAEMEEAARRVVEGLGSEESQAKLREAQEQLKSGVFRQYLKVPAGEAGAKPSQLAATGKADRVYLFISSSMPVTTLRNYAASISKLGQDAVMAMRGLKGGIRNKWTPTIEFSAMVLKKDADCNISAGGCAMWPARIQIDPLLFRRYGISRVPALVYVKGLSLMDTGMSEGKEGNVTDEGHWSVYGDAALSFLMEEVNREAKSESLATMLVKLKE